MIRILYTPDRGQTMETLAPERLDAAVEDQNGLVWVDFSQEAADVSQAILEKTFAFHPLAIDDTINEVHLPKIDDWGAYVYLVLRGIGYDAQDGALTMPELDVFLGPNYLVTFHHGPVGAVQRLWDACRKDQRLLHHGPAYLLYRLLDELIVDYMSAVDELEDNLGELEDRVLERPEVAFQERILRLKRIILRLRRVVTMQREVLGHLARGQQRVISDTDRLYFRDVYDHMVRLYELVDSARDLATVVLDVHLSVMNNRLNDIMKTLTIFTALFMPLTFITGFFGMNFFQPVLAELAPWTAGTAFVVALAVMLLLPATMFVWLRRWAWT